METESKHNVLIVDDEIVIGKVILRLLKSIGAEGVYASSGEEGLEKIKTSSKKFSLVISDEKMPGLCGHEFLSEVREITPETSRFLITGYAEVDTIVKAINKGAIHHYVNKPWDNTELTELIKKGLSDYESVMENKRLMDLAKEQNLKLYSLNKELHEKADAHKKRLSDIELEIEALKSAVKIKSLTQLSPEERSLKKIKQLMVENDFLKKDMTEEFLALTLDELYMQFKDVALRNGFEMPDIL